MNRPFTEAGNDGRNLPIVLMPEATGLDDVVQVTPTMFVRCRSCNEPCAWVFRWPAQAVTNPGELVVYLQVPNDVAECTSEQRTSIATLSSTARTVAGMPSDASTFCGLCGTRTFRRVDLLTAIGRNKVSIRAS